MPTINPPENRRLTTARIYIKPQGGTETIYLGDVSSWEHMQEVKRVPVEDSERGFRLKTGEKIQAVGWTYKATFNEMTTEIMELLHLGTSAADVTQAAIVAPAGTASFSSVKFRRALLLGKESVINVVVKNAGNTVTYTEDTDYVLNAGSGIVEIKSGGAITEGSTINVTFGCDATTRKKINSLTKLSTYGDVRIELRDSHSDRDIELHTFSAQYFITSPGKSDGSKILEVDMSFIATTKPVILTRA